LLKYALITGASGGIGSAIAEKLAEDGWHLYLHYNNNEKAIQQLKEKVSANGRFVGVIQADLSTKEGVGHLLQQIHHPIEAIVHNSGKAAFGLVTDMDDVTVYKMVQLHITSPFLITKALLPNMIAKKRGNIVVVSSIWGLTGASCEVLYSMVKGGQNTFVKALAKELAPSGIRVNAIAPGAIETNMLEGFTKEDIHLLCEEIPMGRIGKPSEVAEAVSFLMSEKASYITGQILSINGGWYC
jgi:3-oxoacyl-[acyl-carrier protein] reductase